MELLSIVLDLSHGPSITDWIQAFAALIAVIGTVITLWKLYQRDEQKQLMIEELKVQSGAAVDQAKHLGEQVAQLGQQVFQLERIHQAIAKGIEYMAKDGELTKELRKIEARPEFEFQGYIPKPGRVEAELRLTNRGGPAKITGFNGLEESTVKATFPQVVRQGDRLTVKMTSDTMLVPQPAFEMTFSDELGNAYAQRFDMRYGVPKAGEVRPG